MICFPNAKINLGLNIISKRPDGYHNIETVFYPIEVKDALEIVPATGSSGMFKQSGITVDGNPDDNLVMKACRLIKNSHKLPEIDIYLRKNIPFGAGLGGGSADAAFMLKLLNEFASLGLNDDELEALASGIGADCPFFIRNKPMLATGIGNEFTTIELSLKGYFLVLVKPDIHVSTKEAYAGVAPGKPGMPLAEIIKLPVDKWKDRMVNDFEKSVFIQYPAIRKIKEKLYTFGAVYASMSGSGSSVFGIFDREVDLTSGFSSGNVFTIRL